jgi:hypothetical protein
MPSTVFWLIEFLTLQIEEDWCGKWACAFLYFREGGATTHANGTWASGIKWRTSGNLMISRCESGMEECCGSSKTRSGLLLLRRQWEIFSQPDSSARHGEDAISIQVVDSAASGWWWWWQHREATRSDGSIVRKRVGSAECVLVIGSDAVESITQCALYWPGADHLPLASTRARTGLECMGLIDAPNWGPPQRSDRHLSQSVLPTPVRCMHTACCCREQIAVGWSSRLQTAGADWSIARFGSRNPPSSCTSLLLLKKHTCVALRLTAHNLAC